MQEREALHQLKNVPEDNRLILLKHMEKSGLMWLDAETFKKHENAIAPKFAHLLGDATGPKRKTSPAKKSM
jgi:hypothetical protein